MTYQTLKLEGLERKQLKDIFHNVLSNQLVLIVQLPNGDEVIIQPKPRLKPLPVLEGNIPENWKEVIYK